MAKSWTTADIPDQTGKHAIVTGATSGIGWHTACELARAGASVVIAGRDRAKAESALARIQAVVPGADAKTSLVDLADQSSVRQFAETQLADPRPVDILVNNAGVMALPRREVTVDGFERQFATNVLGPFLLTGLLLPAILRAPRPRVVTVSSYAHTVGGPVPVEDLNSQREYRPVRAYGKTKLENILFTRELQRRAGGRLLAVTCHPGASRTNLSKNTTTGMKIITWLMGPMLQSAAMGALPTLRAATAPDARPGAYYGPGGLFKLRGPPVEADTAPFARDQDAGIRLFNELERMAGITYPL